MVSERYTQSHTETKYTKCVYIFAKQFHFCKLSIYKSVAWSGSEKKNQWRIIWEILCARNCWCRIHFIYELVSHSWPHASAFCSALSLPFWERQYSRHTIQNISKFFIRFRRIYDLLYIFGVFADYFLNFWFCTSINFRNEKKVGLFFSTFRSLAVASQWHTHTIFFETDSSFFPSHMPRLYCIIQYTDITASSFARMCDGLVYLFLFLNFLFQLVSSLSHSLCVYVSIYFLFIRIFCIAYT